MKKNKGFTLVELLVAMAIIAVLIGLATFGVSLALRAARDSQREKQLDNMRTALTDYLTTHNKYPDRSIVGIQAGTPITFNINSQSTGVEFEGHLTPISTGTTSTRTKYCYENTANGFALAVELENGEYYELGTDDSNECATAKLFW